MRGRYFKETKDKVKAIRRLTEEMKGLVESIEDEPMVRVGADGVQVMGDEEKIDSLILYAAAIKEEYRELKRMAKFAL